MSRCRRASYNSPARLWTGFCGLSDLLLRPVPMSAGIRKRSSARFARRFTRGCQQARSTIFTSGRQPATSDTYGETGLLRGAVSIPGLHRIRNSLHLVAELLDSRARNRPRASTETTAILRLTAPERRSAEFGIFRIGIAHCAGAKIGVQSEASVFSQNPGRGASKRRPDAGGAGKETRPPAVVRVKVRARRTAPGRYRVP